MPMDVQEEQALISAARQALHAGEAARARALLTRLGETGHRATVETLALMGELCALEGDWTAAHNWVVQALQIDRAQASLWVARGRALEQLGQTPAALAALGEAVRLQPDWGLAHYQLARLQRGTGQVAAARAAAADAARLLPSEPDALQLLAMLQQECGEFAAALETLKLALALAPGRASLHHNHGVVLHSLGQFEEALNAHANALRLGLDVADAHYNIGNTLYSLGRSQEAMDAYRQALTRSPLHGLALYDLARMRWCLGHADFCAELERAEREHPQAIEPRLIRGQLLLKAGQAQGAASALEAALTLQATHAPALDALAQARLMLGQSEEALRLHRDAHRLAPQSTAICCNAARTFIAAQHLDEAQQCVLRATNLAPLDQTALALQGLLWRAQGDPRADWLHDVGRCVGVVDLPAPDGFGSLDEFHAELVAALNALHVDREAPIDQTLRNGTQTRGQLFDQPLAAVQALKTHLAQALQAWLGRCETDLDHPFLARRQSQWHFTDSWSSKLRGGGFHTNHVHGHGWLSCCYYVQVPAGACEAPDQAGWIQFGEPDLPAQARARFPRWHAVQPRAGRLVLFPSYFWHGTLPFQDASCRLTVAFDVMPGPAAASVAQGEP
jgi:uncharacterized protein (TIGR02466 family)